MCEKIYMVFASIPIISSVIVHFIKIPHVYLSCWSCSASSTEKRKAKPCLKFAHPGPNPANSCATALFSTPEQPLRGQSYPVMLLARCSTDRSTLKYRQAPESSPGAAKSLAWDALGSIYFCSCWKAVQTAPAACGHKRCNTVLG